MGNQDYWNEKFNQRVDKPLSPEQTIIDHLHHFQKGSVLDIACGDGRNGLYLLSKGFKVTGLDFSQTALDRFAKFAAPYVNYLNLSCVDLTNNRAFDSIKPHDNLLICHYRLNKDQLNKLSHLVNKGGRVLITGFSENHLCNDKIRPDDLIYNDDIKTLLNEFTLYKQSETTDPRGHFITFILIKN